MTERVCLSLFAGVCLELNGNLVNSFIHSFIHSLRRSNSDCQVQTVLLLLPGMSDMSAQRVLMCYQTKQHEDQSNHL